MFDVFTEEIEVLIKDGIANLYWYREDLKKSWLRCGIDPLLVKEIYYIKDINGISLSKRKKMDALYERLRTADYNRRLEISRNFVRLLVEHKNFIPQDEKHRIEVAERSSLKLREIILQQQKEREYKESIKRSPIETSKETYHNRLLIIREDFTKYNDLDPQQRGYALEKIFPRLMALSEIPVQDSFKIIGEQIDGGIKYDGHYYLIELKWTKDKVGPKDIGSFYYKVEGKLDKRGIIISMNGFTDDVIKSLPTGREVKVMLLDGVHLSNVIYGIYTFQELLEHCISHAAYKAQLFCPYEIKK